MSIEEEIAAMMAYLGADNSGIPRGTSASANLNLYQDVMSTVGNPVFLYQQGLITPEQVLQIVQQQTSDLVDLSSFDYASMEDAAARRGDQLAQTAYALIKGGASVSQVLRDILGTGATEAGKISDKLDTELKFLEDDLVAFKSAWDTANQVEKGLLTGEYKLVNGQVFKPKAPADWANAAKAIGLPTFLQNPAMWEIIPDAKLLADAAVGEENAATLAQELNRLVDENGVLRRTVDRKAVNQAASKAGADVYQMILNTTVAGKKRAEDIAVSKERSDYEQSMFGPTPASRGAASPPQLPSGKQRATDIQTRNLAKWIANKAQEVQKTGQTSAAILSRVAPKKEQQDYWAKLGGSYAARAAAEEKRKPVATLEKRVQNAVTRAEDLKKQAYAAGQPLALQILPQAMAAAAALSQPAPKPSRPAPRVLSDQEIATMATMLSGGAA